MPFNHSHIPIQTGSKPYELAPIFNKGLLSIGNNATGVVINLNKMGVQVAAYMGAGMPPVENILTPYGLLGGSYLQRSVIRPRSIILACYVFATTLFNVQKVKQSIINVIAPSNSLQTSKDLFIRYQNIDINGFAVGTALDCPVIYNGGLEGSTDDLYHEAFTLNFLELAPPSIHETTTNTTSMAINVTPGVSSSLHYRTATGLWTSQAVGVVGALAYDSAGLLWYGNTPAGTSAIVQNLNGTNSSPSLTHGTPPADIRKIAVDLNDDMYVGGHFTSTGPYIIRYIKSTTTWGAIAALSTLNNNVNAIEYDNNDRVYIGGDFTAPSNYGLYYYKPPTNAVVGLVGINGPVKALKKAPDGNMIFGGSFTQVGAALAANGIAKWDTVSFAWSLIGSGVAGGSATVNALDYASNGDLIVGGSFTSAGGVACANIARWNGYRYAPLGAGLNGTVNSISVDQSTGDIYASGNFSVRYSLAINSTMITAKAARFNGSYWLPLDFSHFPNPGFLAEAGGIVYNTTYKQMAIYSSSLHDAYYAGNNIINYTGTADCYPTIRITAGQSWMRIVAIINYTTGKGLFFDYEVLKNEVATLQLGTVNGVKFTSNSAGNVIGKILPGSDIATFALVPGINNINVFAYNNTAQSKVELVYQNIHWSFEAGA